MAAKTSIAVCLACQLFSVSTLAQTETEEEDDVPMLDSFQRGVENSVDSTARWFDQFFGDSRTFEDQYDSQGRFSVGPQWSEFDGWEVDSSFRAKVNLPHAENRFSAFIGRVDDDEYVVGDESSRRSSVLRDMSSDSEWLVGLGFDPNQGEENRFSFSAGIRGGINADLYTEGRYLYQYRITDDSQIRTRSALFWRDSDGFGFAQRLDYEHTFGTEWLFRFSTEGTSAERTQGIHWHNNTAIYHLYAEERALALEFWYAGEAKAVVPDKDIGLRLIHRQSWLRDWFFVEKWAGMHWPKETPLQKREGRWLVGIEFEMWYGRGS